MITCTKCNGCGKTKKPRYRAKSVKSTDPTKKWCSKCQSFIDLSGFYSKTPYCKVCHNKKMSGIKRKTPQVKKKITDIICAICGIKAKGFSSSQKTCSKPCHLKRMNRDRMSRAHQLLPNYLSDEESKRFI